MTASTRSLFAWILAEGLVVAMVTAVIGPAEPADGRRLFVLALLIAVAMLQRAHLTVATTAGVVVIYVVARAVDLDAESGLKLSLTSLTAGALGLVAVAIVSDLLAQSVRRLAGEVTDRARQMSDLEHADPATGLLRPSYGLQAIAEEVARGGLYGRDCSVALLGLDDQLGGATDTALLARVTEALRAHVNAADRLIEQGDDILVLLAETNSERAELIAAELCKAAEEVLAAPVRAGVASFPVSEVTASGLVAEAKASLSFARAARVPVAGPQLLLA